MSKVQYIEKRFSASTWDLLLDIQGILEEFEGIPMTVRQLYYQVISKDLLPNSISSYRKVAKLVKDARLAGEIDWDAIEDRLRRPQVPSSWDSVDAIVETAIQAFRLDRWADQPVSLEVWLEKDALAGIVGDVTNKWQVTLQVNRGYSSVTAMREAAMRLRQRRSQGHVCIVGYLGDHDPSGEDMVRDIRDRLDVFGAGFVDVEKLAIMQDDIERYDLPPQPPKRTDSRSAAFRRAHGEECVELDALRPDVLQKRVDRFVRLHLDMSLYMGAQREEERQVERIRKVIA